MRWDCGRIWQKQGKRVFVLFRGQGEVEFGEFGGLDLEERFDVIGLITLNV